MRRRLVKAVVSDLAGRGIHLSPQAIVALHGVVRSARRRGLHLFAASLLRSAVHSDDLQPHSDLIGLLLTGYAYGFSHVAFDRTQADHLRVLLQRERTGGQCLCDLAFGLSELTRQLDR